MSMSVNSSSSNQYQPFANKDSKLLLETLTPNSPDPASSTKEKAFAAFNSYLANAASRDTETRNSKRHAAERKNAALQAKNYSDVA